MNILVITPDRNTPGKKDFTGAFLPEALAFARRHAVPLTTHHLRVDLSKSLGQRRAELLGKIAGVPTLDAVAFFCHGLTRRLPQLGWSTENVDELAQALVAKSAPNLRVALYACSTAQGDAPGGDNGFADRLRDALCAAGAVDCQVDAHLGAGHTTFNPRVRRFEGRGSSGGGIGGHWIVTPGSAKYRAWRKKLRTPFRFDFPFLSSTEIVDRLESP